MVQTIEQAILASIESGKKIFVFGLSQKADLEILEAFKKLSSQCEEVFCQLDSKRADIPNLSLTEMIEYLSGVTNTTTLIFQLSHLLCFGQYALTCTDAFESDTVRRHAAAAPSCLPFVDVRDEIIWHPDLAWILLSGKIIKTDVFVCLSWTSLSSEALMQIQLHKDRERKYYDKRWGEGSSYTSVQFQHSLFSMHVRLAVYASETTEIHKDEEEMLWSKMACGKVFSSISSVPITLLFCTHVCQPHTLVNAFREKVKQVPWSRHSSSLKVNSKNLQKAGQKVFLWEKLNSFYDLNIGDVRWGRKNPTQPVWLPEVLNIISLQIHTASFAQFPKIIEVKHVFLGKYTEETDI